MSNGFVAAKVSSCCQLDVEDNRLAQPLCSGRITGRPRSYGLVRPCAPHWYARLVVVATWTSPLSSERQVPAVGQGAVLLETRDWDDLPERVMVASYSASRSLRTAAI